MALKPLFSEHRQPVGNYDLATAAAVEGGMIGSLENEAGAGGYAESPTDYKVVVNLSPDPDAGDMRVIGLIDDSVTGAGYGTLFGTQALSVDNAQAVNFPTTLGSGKCSLWMDSGIFVTDQYEIPVGSLIAAGTALYSSLASKITNNAAPLSNDLAIGGFIEFVTTKQLGSLVSPAEPDKIWAVFKFNA